MLGRRCGQLHIWQAGDSRPFHLHIDNDCLLAVLHDQQPILDPHRVRDTIFDLSRCQDGRFEFQRESSNTLLRHYELSITRLLLGASTVIDEISHYRDRLPAPDTRFVLLDTAPHTLDHEMRGFLDRAEAHLMAGTTSNELARALGAHAPQIQLMMYKLRTNGLIAPLRAQALPTAPLEVSASYAPAGTLQAEPHAPAAGLIGRLLGALTRRRKFPA